MITYLIWTYFSGKAKKSPTSLSVVAVQATDIPPKETVVYTKQTQTSNTGGVERDGKYKLVWCKQAVNVFQL